jgi:hypothetical protein
MPDTPFIVKVVPETEYATEPTSVYEVPVCCATLSDPDNPSVVAKPVVIWNVALTVKDCVSGSEPPLMAKPIP